MPGFVFDDFTPVTFTFQDNQEATATDTTHTFSSMGIGTAASDRYVLACLSWQGSAATRTVSSVTIGGVTATQVGSTANAGSFSFRSTAMFIALVPSGTTADVVITVNADAVNWACVTYSAAGLLSATPASTATSTAADPTASMSCDANGAIIGCAVTGAASSPSATWAGIAEDSDQNYGASSQQCFSTAHTNFSTAQSGLTCTCDFSTANGSGGVFAAFNP